VRSVLLMECFEPSAAPEQVVARLEVVGRHSTAALYNALEHRRIPMRFLWMPLAKIQEGLGGKAKAILTLIGAGLTALILVLIFVPYPLKMEARGQILPRDRRYIYSTEEGSVRGFKEFLKAGSRVSNGQNLILMFNLDLGRRLKSVKDE